MGDGNPFVDLRRLADWFATLAQRPHAAPSQQVERLVARLGVTCIPLLGRELGSPERPRRDVARAALATLAAAGHKPRVIVELHAIATGARGGACDDGKLSALGLLAELGEKVAARFADPPALQRRSALALAAQLDTPSDIAAAADLMVHELGGDDIVQLVDVMADAAPEAAHRLGVELCGRLDLAVEIRERIALAALALVDTARAQTAAPRAPRPTRVEVLVDAGARVVVVASRRVPGARRWRRWAVLVDARGQIEDCIHEDRGDSDGAEMVARLVADGYRVASDDYEHARALVSAAARHTADRGDAADRLGSAYYVGRDLLDLGEAHLGGRTHADPISSTLGRAVELIGDGEHARARLLLARCRANDPDVAAATAACLLAQGQPADAIAHLARAIEAEPTWPLHHWNVAAACHQLNDSRGCYHALRRFLATSSQPTGLYADPEQPSRVALAHRMVAELERTSALAGAPLARPRRKRRTTRRTGVSKT